MIACFFATDPVDQLFFTVAPAVGKAVEQVAAFLGHVKEMNAPVLFRLAADKQALFFHAVDDRDEICSLDAKGFSNIALLEARITADDDQNGKIGGSQTVPGQHLGKIICHGKLRVSQVITDRRRQQAVVNSRHRRVAGAAALGLFHLRPVAMCQSQSHPIPRLIRLSHCPNYSRQRRKTVSLINVDDTNIVE